jgi:hypothetical protein
MKQGSRSWLKTAGTVLVVTTNLIGAKRNVPVVLKEGDVLKISSILFKESPVYHEIPPIYEGLGLPDLSSFIEQPFEFVYTMGKVDRLGHGSIRFYKQQGDFKVTISDDLPGVGPTRLEKLKGLLLEQAKNALIENIESEIEKRNKRDGSGDHY